jgi:hypothetical protein
VVQIKITAQGIRERNKGRKRSLKIKDMMELRVALYDKPWAGVHLDVTHLWAMEFVSTTVLRKAWISRSIMINACSVDNVRRRRAIQIMLKAIDGYLVKGVETTLHFVQCLNTFTLGILTPISLKNTISADLLKK